MKKLFVLALTLSSTFAVAEPLTTPHTFTSGTPALASEVNENFQAHQNAINEISNHLNNAQFSPFLYVNGVKLGVLVYGDSLFKLNSGYMCKVRSTEGYGLGSPYVTEGGYKPVVLDDLLSYQYFESTNCSGQRYITDRITLSFDGGFSAAVAQPSFLSNGRIFKIYSAPAVTSVFYSDKLQVTKTMLSVLAGRDTCTQINATLPAYAIYPNNPFITGIDFLNHPSYEAFIIANSYILID